MKCRLFCVGRILIVLLFCSASMMAEDVARHQQAKLYGKVKNTWSGEPIGDVTVFIESVKKGTKCDELGNYELLLNNGTYTVRFSGVGLKSEVYTIDIDGDTQFDVFLKEEVFNLKEVEISSERQDAHIAKPEMGKNTVAIEKLLSMPSFLGETDVVKSLMFLPGVTTVGEGASGFNVRGGSVDQNLILQDGGLIFNPSHVFGFFSSFNPAIVKNATLYKSGLPARYGGRLSSVLDVGLKEGDLKKLGVNGGIGLVSSKVAIEGPILKDKLSFIVATRISYSDWLLNFAEDDNIKNSSAGFQDVNAKLTYRINTNNKLNYSGYYSNDNFALASDTAFSWQTTNHVLQWTHSFNEKMVAYVDFSSGQYGFNIEDEGGVNAFNIESNIDYKTFRANFVHDITPSNQINFGAEAISYKFNPGQRKPLTEDSGVDPLTLEHERSSEYSIYVEDELKFTEKFSARAGLRYSTFRNVGDGSDFIYGEGPREKENIIDTVYYDDGEVIANYGGLEPRLTLNYTLGATSSVKLSYNRSRQYLHLVTNTAAVTPTDLWKTSNKYIKPEVGDQFSLGYFRNFNDNTIETSVEGYYKTAENIVDFKDGTVLLMNENIEGALINGTSEAYGVEVFVNKKSGKFTGWMSYTFSRIFRTVNGRFDEEKINLGDPYPANNDKPHGVSLAVNYKKNPVIEFGANFTYSTGRPATVPLSLYNVSNQSNVFNFSGRNKGRIPDYHRLDVSMTVNSKPRVDRKWHLSWTFAVYNLYGRKNAYSVFYENMYGSPPKAYKLSVLGSAFPSVMLNFKF